MHNTEVLSLFPTAITTSDINGFTKNELDVVKSFKTQDNVFNKMSVDHHVLDHPGLSRIKSEFEEGFSYYINEILLSVNDIKPRITQSWLNYTKIGERHKRHYHSNSFLSGVLYVQTDGEDLMQVDKPFYEFWNLDCGGNYNDFNSVHWDIPSTQGRIIIFPSTLMHQVREKVSDSSCRISLACNMVPSGKIGNDRFLNELEL